MGNLKQLNFLEVAQYFENKETNEPSQPSQQIIYMVRTSPYVAWVKEEVLKSILEKNNISEGVDVFLEKYDFQNHVDIIQVIGFRGALTADLEPINTTADILNSLYFLTDKTQ